MLQNHEILCPAFINCPICTENRKVLHTKRIINHFNINDDITILNKHFYLLTISLKPTRETYFRFSLDPLKKVGRELINGLCSISSVSNRKWWNMFVDSGVRYFSVEQSNSNDFPTINQHLLFYGEKDNLDSRMDTQLKYRLKKINKNFNYTLQYIGQYDIKSIREAIKLDISFDPFSQAALKLGETVIEEINKLKDLKPIFFGVNYNKKSTKNQIIKQ
jgi:hypothetical protein